MMTQREPTSEDIETALQLELDDGLRAVLRWWGHQVAEDLRKQQAQAAGAGAAASAAIAGGFIKP